MTMRNRRAERMAVVTEALSSLLPAAACYTDSKGNDLVKIGSIGLYLNGIAYQIVDDLDEAGL